MFNGIEPQPIVRVIGSNCSVGINSQTSLIYKRVCTRRTAPPRSRCLMPEELNLTKKLRGTGPFRSLRATWHDNGKYEERANEFHCCRLARSFTKPPHYET
jgi:hypothetical protein